jgi:hypothetical protein
MNGCVPFPTGFPEVVRLKFGYLNFLRFVGRALVPGYVETYKKADKILAGSTYIAILNDSDKFVGVVPFFAYPLSIGQPGVGLPLQ